MEHEETELCIGIYLEASETQNTAHTHTHTPPPDTHTPKNKNKINK